VKRCGIKNFTISIFLPLLINACSTQNEKTPEARAIEMTLTAGKNSNPDRDGRAAPVEVFIYALTEQDNFNGSDYFTLLAGNNPALVTEIKMRKQVILKPQGEKKLDFTVEGEVNSLAVVAAYRDINEAQWSALYSLPKQQSNAWYQIFASDSKAPLKIAVAVEQLSVSIKEVN